MAQTPRRYWAFGLLLIFPALAQDAPERASGWTPKTIVHTKRDMVVAAHPLAVDAGVEMLRAGGTATDAAIAVQLVLNIVEPQSSGIGGGAFMLHYAATRKHLETYDGRETAPMAASEELLMENGRPRSFAARVGGRAVGAPGVMRMMERAHRDHGKLDWEKLFAPAIKIADEGFAISPRLFSALQGDALEKREPTITSQRGEAAALFFNADATPKAVGTIIKNPRFAATLRSLARDGADAFYEGALAREIIAAVKNHPTNPGLLDEADLRSYQPKKRAPLCVWYREQSKICTMGAPSSAAAVLMSLGMLEQFEIGKMSPESGEATHLIAESFRLAYADRTHYIADTDFVRVPMAGLLDKDYLKSRAALINPQRSMGAAKPGVPAGAALTGGDHSAEAPGTTHFSIVDEAGNVVSMTSSIEGGFGSKQMVAGFLLNNQLTDFSFSPKQNGAPAANRVEPGKRPRSAMSPVIVFDRAGDFVLVVGSPGGPQIIQYVTKTIIGVLDWKLNVQDAVSLGHFGTQAGATTYLERGRNPDGLAKALATRGHLIGLVDFNSGLHAIARTAQGLAGGADPRREGVAKGR